MRLHINSFGSLDPINRHCVPSDPLVCLLFTAILLAIPTNITFRKRFCIMCKLYESLNSTPDVTNARSTVTILDHCRAGYSLSLYRLANKYLRSEQVTPASSW